MKKTKIIIIGSCNTDMVINTDHLPLPGETVLGGRFLMNPGGKGANQAVAAARLGGDVIFQCCVGDDLFGRQAVEAYKREGIDTSRIKCLQGAPSGVALISVDRHGENSIVVASGANAELTPADVAAMNDVFETGGILLMQLETPLETIEQAAEIAHKAGMRVILNPAPAPKEPLSAELLSHVDVIIPNATEAGILSGQKVSDWSSAEAAAKIIASRGTRMVILTLGARGSLIYDGQNFERVEATKVKAVDTTAAGDTFCGALCVALSEGKSIVDAARFASKASAIAVTRMGAQSSIPLRAEIETI